MYLFIYVCIYLSSSASSHIIGSLVDTFSSHTCLFIYLFIFKYLWIKISFLWCVNSLFLWYSDICMASQAETNVRLLREFYINL